MRLLGKRLLSVFLSLMIILGVVAVGGSIKASATTVDEIREKLKIIDKEGYYSEGFGNLQPDTTGVKENCWEYVKRLSTYCFGTEVTPPSSTVKERNYIKGSSLNSYKRVKPALVNCTYSEIVELFKFSEPGDLVGFYSRVDGELKNHIMFVGENTGSKITFYHEWGTVVHKDTVKLTENGLKGLSSFGAYKAGTASFEADDLGVCLFRCKERTGSGSSASTPVNDNKTYTSSFEYDNTSIEVKIKGRDLTIEVESDAINNGKIYSNYANDTNKSTFVPLSFCISDFYVDNWSSDKETTIVSKLKKGKHAFCFDIRDIRNHNSPQYVSLTSDVEYELSYLVPVKEGDGYYYHGIIEGCNGGYKECNNLNFTFSKNKIMITTTLPTQYADSTVDGKPHYTEGCNIEFDNSNLNIIMIGWLTKSKNNSNSNTNPFEEFINNVSKYIEETTATVSAAISSAFGVIVSFISSLFGK